MINFTQPSQTVFTYNEAKAFFKETVKKRPVDERSIRIALVWQEALKVAIKRDGNAEEVRSYLCGGFSAEKLSETLQHLKQEDTVNQALELSQLAKSYHPPLTEEQLKTASQIVENVSDAPELKSEDPEERESHIWNKIDALIALSKLYNQERIPRPEALDCLKEATKTLDEENNLEEYFGTYENVALAWADLGSDQALEIAKNIEKYGVRSEIIQLALINTLLKKNRLDEALENAKKMKISGEMVQALTHIALAQAEIDLEDAWKTAGLIRDDRAIAPIRRASNTRTTGVAKGVGPGVQTSQEERYDLRPNQYPVFAKLILLQAKSNLEKATQQFYKILQEHPDFCQVLAEDIYNPENRNCLKLLSFVIHLDNDELGSEMTKLLDEHAGAYKESDSGYKIIKPPVLIKADTRCKIASERVFGLVQALDKQYIR
jgi:hypothetical protein